MEKFSRPLNEPKFNNSNIEMKSQNAFHTDVTQSNDDFLLMQFRLFIDEVQKIIKTSKVIIHKNHTNDKDSEDFKNQKNKIDEVNNSHYAPEKNLPKQVSDRLCKLIEIQNMELMRNGSRAAQSRFEDAKYIKAAIADELLLTQEWPGKIHFTDYLIETSLFGTSVAGEKFFEKIDEILELPPGRETEIERMYLFALAIGFEGKYKGYNSENEINKILNELFVHITRREPDFGPKNSDKEINGRFVSKQAYQHTISNIKPIRVFRISKQSVIFAISCISLLIISQVLWIWLTAPLRDSLDKVAINISDPRITNKNIRFPKKDFISTRQEKFNV